MIVKQMDRSKFPMWVQNYDLMIKAWNIFIKENDPYKSIINRLSLTITNKFPYFYNKSESVDLIAACRRLYWILEEEINYEEMLADPLSYFISSIPQKFSAKRLTDRLGAKVSSIPGSNKLILAHCALVEEEYPLVSFMVSDEECYSITQANYASLQRYSISYSSLLSLIKLMKSCNSSNSSEYVFVNKTEVKIITMKDAKTKSFRDDVYFVASNKKELIDLYISISPPKISPSPNEIITNTPHQGQKRKNLPKPIRHKVWINQFKNSLVGKCVCCDRDITYDNWDCGHIIAVANGGEDKISNMLPTCRRCNLDMGIMDMNDYITSIKKYE